MSAVDLSISLFEAERLVKQEQPKNPNEKGDFEGSVVGTWQRLNSKGLGVVVYGNKEYKTIPLGTRSITRGTKVQLNFTEGVYYSNW